MARLKLWMRENTPDGCQLIKDIIAWNKIFKYKLK